MATGKQVKRATLAVVGSVVLLVGVALLVLPGPGLLLVLGGLLILASVFPALERYVDPVRDRAMKPRGKACPRRCASPGRCCAAWPSSPPEYSGACGFSRGCRCPAGAPDPA